jgi:hypothetical protein
MIRLDGHLRPLRLDLRLQLARADSSG